MELLNEKQMVEKIKDFENQIATSKSEYRKRDLEKAVKRLKKELKTYRFLKGDNK